MIHLNQDFERERERELKILPYKPSNKSDKGFTLVELLIVISILAALAAAVVVVINPAEMLRQGRDSTRMREIGTLHRAISMLRIDTPAAPLGSSNTIHVSIPSDSPTCDNLGLPTPPPGWSYRCVSAANLRNIDNTGWIPIDFTVMPRGSPLASLPIDPVNTVASSNFYVFVTDGRTWTLASLMESERHAPSAARDGGTDAARFEAGTNLSLWTSASGLVGYWSFDGTGSIAHNQTVGLRDISGRGNHGTASNPNATGMAFVPGRVGNAVTFDGVDDRMSAPISPTWLTTSNYTFSLWVKMLSRDPTQDVFFHLRNSPATWDWQLRQMGTNLLGWGIQRADGTHRTYNFTTRLPLNSWRFVTVSMGSDVRLYIDGILERTHTRDTEFVRTTNGLFLASESGGTGWATNSLIDEVRIYNRALSAAEIRTIFNATR